jgi:hypothetical protein
VLPVLPAFVCAPVDAPTGDTLLMLDGMRSGRTHRWQRLLACPELCMSSSTPIVITASVLCFQECLNPDIICSAHL